MSSLLRASSRRVEDVREGHNLRVLLQFAALGVLAWSITVSYLNGAGTVAEGFVLVVPLGCVVALLAERWRAEILAALAALVCLGTPDNLFLAPAAASLVFLSAVSGRRTVPWPAVIGAAAGSLASTAVYSYQPTPAPYLAALTGLALALVVRSRDRLANETVALRRSTRELRGQALWLEQRTTLARELHDVVGHHVTAMVVQAESGQVGDARAALRAIADAGRVALGELDQLVVHLRDPAATLSVTAPPRLSDIDELLAEPLRRQGVTVRVRIDPDPGLDEIGVLTTYRVAQEALTNIAKHARASAAWVELVRLPAQGGVERVRLRVSDDGVGPPGSTDRGSGVLGIDERVRAVRGTWDLGERPGGGTMLEVSLPLESAG